MDSLDREAASEMMIVRLKPSRNTKNKQMRLDREMIETVNEFARLTRRSQSAAWEMVAYHGLVALGATVEGEES